MADFTGFYFNNIHSSTYHLIRVSSGNRYGDSLFPSFDDHTVELVGGHGSIYDSTQYKEREFSISVAFDSVTEEDLRAIRQWLVPDKVGELRFDECPYKAYRAKLKSSPKFEYICFMQQKENSYYGDQERIYKGEATLEFVAYDPFGYCCDNSHRLGKMGMERIAGGVNWQVLESYAPFTILDENVTEWAHASGIKKERTWSTYNNFVRTKRDKTYIYKALLYNPGDFDADFDLYISFHDVPAKDLKNKNIYIKIREKNNSNDEGQQFVFSTGEIQEQGRVLLSTKKHSLQVLYGGKTVPLETEMRYDLVKTGNWLKIPKGEREIIIQCGINIIEPIRISYCYKYY